ncbi:undecaprenyl-phosphate glucose phosphotransferase [Rhizobiaceae bacterium BDR2-2]|uniref:Undecaprenyl-phosphate glucose phosphotransferase n=1 Tax=Ectorhizobium quercum TaxID=2965071 RepID=A0AAE3N2F6_9HYPH|nr:undecaprenyl-phosphate glucose phosphotransferase [Ectorhizobium quercum]MCX8998961.1 undecaprenyl-phosphate glucose phosphotransferase [Ectorhizobium quercum]
MNNLEQNEQFDVEGLKRKLSEGSSPPGNAGNPADEPAVLNPLARSIARQFSEHSRTPNIVIGQFRLFEFTALLAIGLVAGAIAGYDGLLDFAARTALVAFGAGLTVLAMQILDLYQISALRAPSLNLKRIVAAWAGGYAALAGLLFLTGALADFDRQILAVWFGGAALFLLAVRFLFAIGVRHWGRNGLMERRAVIVGGGQAAKDLIRALEQQPDNDIRICGIFDDRGADRSPNVVAGYPKLGTVSELVEFARLTRIDMLIIALPLSAEARIMDLIRKLWVLPVDIRLAAHANRLRFRPRSYSHVGAVPMLDIFDKPIRDWDSVAKRAFDIIFSVIALTLLWPVLIGTAIAVKLNSKGPVFFVQKRHGFNNEVINVLKFRSMYTDRCDPTAKQAVTRNDPRVTPVGRIIRKTSIDELPQLFNVLKGDLSLVGPRPHAISAQAGEVKFADVAEGYFARHRVKPGVTGWAQINGWRGEVDNSDKIRFRTAFDLYYIENWSLLFDLKILFLTPIRLLKTENAY